MPITPAQCRAARSLLNWSQETLALKADVSRATVADFESSTRQPLKNNLRAMMDCMIKAGIDFLGETGDHGVGVRFSARRVTYLKSVKIDRRRGIVSIPMHYAGKPFACELELHDLSNFLLADFSSDEEIAAAVSRMFDHIYIVTEKHAATGIRNGVLQVSIEMLLKS